MLNIMKNQEKNDFNLLQGKYHGSHIIKEYKNPDINRFRIKNNTIYHTFSESENIKNFGRWYTNCTIYDFEINLSDSINIPEYNMVNDVPLIIYFTKNCLINRFFIQIIQIYLKITFIILYYGYKQN